MRSFRNVDRFRADRSKVERLRADGMTLATLAARYGISLETVSRIFVEEWGYPLQRRKSRRNPTPSENQLPDFAPGRKYKIKDDEFFFLEEMGCRAGSLWIFRSKAGWKATFTHPQLVGEKVRTA